MLHIHARHGRHALRERRLHHRMPRDDVPLLIHQHRRHHAVLAQAGAQLADLTLAMHPRVCRGRDQRRGVEQLQFCCRFHSIHLVSSRYGDTVDHRFPAVGRKSHAEGGLRSYAPRPETFPGWGMYGKSTDFPPGFGRVRPAPRLSERPAGHRRFVLAFALLSAAVLRPWHE